MTLIRKYLYLLNVVCLTVQAQHYSDEERFSLSYSKGCVPVTISVTANTTPETPPVYFYDATLPDQTTDTFHTYYQPGIYKIVQLPSHDPEEGPKTDTLTFEVLPATPPEFIVYQCSNTEIQVEVTDDLYHFYVVKFTTSDSVIYMPDTPSPTYNYGETSGNVQVIGYYDDAYPSCGDSFQAFNINNPVEAELTYASVSEGCRNEFFLHVEAQTDPMTKYRIQISQGTENFQSVYEGVIGQNNSPYAIDLDLSDPTYCVRINTLNPCDGTEIIGESLCYTIDPASLSPLTGAYASYQQEGVRLHISPTLGQEISVSRRTRATDNYSPHTMIKESYLDQVPKHSRRFEYKLVQQDTCGNSIDSVELAPPYIKLLDKNRHTNTITTTSEDPRNRLGAYHKSVIVHNEDSSIVVELPYDEFIELPAEVGRQQLIRTRYHYPNEGIDVYSNKITTSYEITIFVPTAFTPNGDGMNDQLEIFGVPEGTDEFEISIFNRWGEHIHHTVNQQFVWDGRINQEPAPDGTYRYRLVFKLATGEVKSQVGTFVLLKK